jgi:hypothetical protein
VDQPLCFAPDSWTGPMDILRNPPTADATSTTAAQIRRLVGLFGGDGEPHFSYSTPATTSIAPGEARMPQRIVAPNAGPAGAAAVIR